MPKRAAISNSIARRTGSPSPVVKEALEVTWLLKGDLKNAQIAYIRVGALLAKVRDEKLYAALHHPDMESYAEERLHLGKTSLYRYLKVYDWICQYHKEWLDPKPNGFIPDLSDVADLIWIEHELARADLDPKERAALEELRQKALEGRLRKGELDKWRHHRRPPDEEALRSFLSKLRLLRQHGSALAHMPPEVITDLDAAIGTLVNVITTNRAGPALAEIAAAVHGGAPVSRSLDSRGDRRRYMVRKMSVVRH